MTHPSTHQKSHVADRQPAGSAIQWTRLVIFAAWVFAPVAIAGKSHGAQINYGDHMGANVTYVDVTEDSGSEPLPLFGAPNVTGNSIDFNPTGFDASSANVGSDITASNLSFMVAAKPGSRIQSLLLTEAGNTTLAGNVPSGSMGTASAVFASGVLDVHEVDFQPINHISVPFSLTFNPSGGTYFLGTDGGGGPIFHTEWTGSVNMSVESILIANGYMIPPAQGATKISVDLNNVLTAVSQAGTSALISKNDFGGVTIRIDAVGDPGIPEPGCLTLAAIGALTLAARRRSIARERCEHGPVV